MLHKHWNRTEQEGMPTCLIPSQQPGNQIQTIPTKSCHGLIAQILEHFEEDSKVVVAVRCDHLQCQPPHKQHDIAGVGVLHLEGFPLKWTARMKKEVKEGFLMAKNVANENYGGKLGNAVKRTNKCGKNLVLHRIDSHESN